jgi:hypothetical protein
MQYLENKNGREELEQGIEDGAFYIDWANDCLASFFEKGDKLCPELVADLRKKLT